MHVYTHCYALIIILQHGRYPLWYAVEYERADLVLLLIENKADVDLTSNVTQYPLAVECLNLKCTFLMLQDDFSDTALNRVCYRGYTEIADILVKNGADVNYMDAVNHCQLVTCDYFSVIESSLTVRLLHSVLRL